MGLEDVEDIIWDLDQALTYATGLNHAGERVGESSADKIVEAEEAVAAAKAAEDAAAAELLLAHPAPAYYHPRRRSND